MFTPQAVTTRAPNQLHGTGSQARRALMLIRGTLLTSFTSGREALLRGARGVIRKPGGSFTNRCVSSGALQYFQTAKLRVKRSNTARKHLACPVRNCKLVFFFGEGVGIECSLAPPPKKNNNCTLISVNSVFLFIIIKIRCLEQRLALLFHRPPLMRPS